MHQALPAYQVTQADAPMSAQEAACYTTGVAGYLYGIQPRERELLPGYDSGILTLFIIAVMLVSINVRRAKSFFSRMFKDLYSVRRRANAFDDTTVSESSILLSLILLLCVSEGSLLFSFMRHHQMDLSLDHFLPLSLMPMAVVAMVIYYLFQVASYDIVAYTFTDKIGRNQWVRGFNASQGFLALGLLVPALVTLFYPSLTLSMCFIAATLYILSRLTFIIKGFRIFYTDISSFLFFILYLCTLEIAPVALIVRFCRQ